MTASRLFLLLAFPCALLAVDVDDGSGGDTLSPGINGPVHHGKFMRHEMRPHEFGAAMSMHSETEEGVPGPRIDAASLMQLSPGSEEESSGGVDGSQAPVPQAPIPPLASGGVSVDVANSTIVVQVAAQQKTKCPEVVYMAADDKIKDLHPLAAGVYHLIKTDVEPPIYVNRNHMFYMYYVQSSKMWRVGKRYENVAAAVSSNPATEALCPPEVENWYAFDPSLPGDPSLQWTTRFKIRVTAGWCPFQVNITGGEKDQPQLMGIFSMQTYEKDKRAVYTNANGKFLRYCADMEAWRIGSDMNTCAAGVGSNATSANLCPTSPEAWCVLKNGTWTPKEIRIKAINPATHDWRGNLMTPNTFKDETVEGVPLKSGSGAASGAASGTAAASADSEASASAASGKEFIPADVAASGDRAGMANADKHVAVVPVDRSEKDKHSDSAPANAEGSEASDKPDLLKQKGYVKAGVDTVDCPTDSVDADRSQCRSVAEAIHGQYADAEQDDLPYGCIMSVMIGGAGQTEADNSVKFNAKKYGIPSTNWEKICRLIVPGENVGTPVNMTVADEAEATTAKPVSDGKQKKKEEAKPGKAIFMAGGTLMGLIVVGLIVFFIVRWNKTTDKPKDKLVGGEERTPAQGDYVLVVSQNRKGWIAAPPDAEWRYTVTYEDDNSTSALLVFGDVQLVDSGAAAPVTN